MKFTVKSPTQAKDQNTAPIFTLCFTAAHSLTLRLNARREMCLVSFEFLIAFSKKGLQTKLSIFSLRLD
jgi:hypothetical protein